jgi:hypothetical protein
LTVPSSVLLYKHTALTKGDTMTSQLIFDDAVDHEHTTGGTVKGSAVRHTENVERLELERLVASIRASST